MDFEASMLLAMIREKPWPAAPFQLMPGVMVLSTEKLVRRTEGYLQGMEGVKDYRQKPAYRAYLDRLRLLDEKLDEIRVEQHAG